jgi:hypothetical protein
MRYGIKKGQNSMFVEQKKAEKGIFAEGEKK